MATVKVGDYGLSKSISMSRRTAQTQSVGTVHYMAPEISTGNYNKQIDVYAAGIILYEMLTGQVPFDGESAGEILMKHLTAPPDLQQTAGRVSADCAKGAGEEPESSATRAWPRWPAPLSCLADGRIRWRINLWPPLFQSCRPNPSQPPGRFRWCCRRTHSARGRWNC